MSSCGGQLLAFLEGQLRPVALSVRSRASILGCFEDGRFWMISAGHRRFGPLPYMYIRLCMHNINIVALFCRVLVP